MRRANGDGCVWLYYSRVAVNAELKSYINFFEGQSGKRRELYEFVNFLRQFFKVKYAVGKPTSKPETRICLPSREWMAM